MKNLKCSSGNKKLGFKAQVYQVGYMDYLVEVEGLDINPLSFSQFGPAASTASDIARFPYKYIRYDGYSVLAVCADNEKQVYTAGSLKAACEMAMSRNNSPYSILYIVVKPDGSRLTVNEQNKYLASIN